MEARPHCSGKNYGITSIKLGDTFIRHHTVEIFDLDETKVEIFKLHYIKLKGNKTKFCIQ